MARGDVVQPLAGCDDQRLDRLERRVGQRRFGQQRQRAVDAAQPLHVDRQCVEEDARHGMPGNLRQVRVLAARRHAAGGLVHAPGADDQQPLRPQVDGRRQRRGLAHRAVAKPAAHALVFQLGGRKDKGNGRRRQQVRLRQPRRCGHALRTQPGRDGPRRVVEREVLAAAVARGRDRQRVQVLLLEHQRQPLDLHQPLQQRGQRRVVQQRAWPHAPPARDHPADRQHGQPVCAGAHHAQRIGTVDLVGREVFPHLRQHFHRGVEAVGMAGQRGGVDGPGRGAADDAEGRAQP